MRNRALFNSKKDMEIARLKWEIEKRDRTIKAFKEYDEERKKYYSDALRRLGEAESLLQEIEDTNDLARKLLVYKDEISRLNLRIMTAKVQETMTDEEMREVCQYKRIKEQNENLRKEVESLHRTVNELLGRISKPTTEK